MLASSVRNSASHTTAAPSMVTRQTASSSGAACSTRDGQRRHLGAALVPLGRVGRPAECGSVISHGEHAACARLDGGMVTPGPAVQTEANAPPHVAVWLGRTGGDRAPPSQLDRAHAHHTSACSQAQRLRQSLRGRLPLLRRHDGRAACSKVPWLAAVRATAIAPEAHPLAQGYLLGLGGEPSPRGYRRSSVSPPPHPRHLPAIPAPSIHPAPSAPSARRLRSSCRARSRSPSASPKASPSLSSSWWRRGAAWATGR